VAELRAELGAEHFDRRIDAVRHVTAWAVIGAVSGVLAGIASFVFLEVLDAVTDTRIDNPWLLFCLPAAGLGVGVAYHYLGGRAGRGNVLIIEQVERPTDWVPRRMAPLVLIGTWITHLFGGSAGREGTAVQMSGSLTDGMARVARLGPDGRKFLLAAAIAGGFGSVFGVPFAGIVFAFEVQRRRRFGAIAFVPIIAASFVGDFVTRALGHEHAERTGVVVDLGLGTMAKLVISGVVFGVTAAAFIGATRVVSRLSTRLLPWPPLRPMMGGVAIVALALLFGRDYLGLSLPLADAALAGETAGAHVFALKLVFTAVTLGSAFPGGEVTPLFVIGATLGAAIAVPLGLPVALVAAVGFVAVFGGAANVPITCVVMGVELFGPRAALPLVVVCLVANATSTRHSIYRPHP
jgi:H+/Cl- antiporter ClcA